MDKKFITAQEANEKPRLTRLLSVYVNRLNVQLRMAISELI